jgi:hypothetical protein
MDRLDRARSEAARAEATAPQPMSLEEVNRGLARTAAATYLPEEVRREILGPPAAPGGPPASPEAEKAPPPIPQTGVSPERSQGPSQASRPYADETRKAVEGRLKKNPGGLTLTQMVRKTGLAPQAAGAVLKDLAAEGAAGVHTTEAGDFYYHIPEEFRAEPVSPERPEPSERALAEGSLNKPLTRWQELRREVIRQGALSALRGVTPGWATFKNAIEGLKAQREWYAPGSQGADVAKAVEEIVMGGGRAGMDAFYRTSHLQAFADAARNVYRDLSLRRKPAGGDLARGVIRALPALAEWLNKPTMEHWVPMLKMGAALENMRYEMDWLGRQGHQPDVHELRQRFGRIWDSMDNRFGQLVYDNLFWHRTFKDIAMATVRAVGWNVGTWREYGGAAKDIPSSLRGLRSGEGISDRVAYVIGATFGSALLGAVTQYLLTGKPPEEPKDLFYPKTGRTRPDGAPDRLSFPTYTDHDILPLFNRADEGPYRIGENVSKAVGSKLSPALAVPYHAFAVNQDDFGTAIRDPNDPVTRQTYDTMMYILKATGPYSIDNLLRARQQKLPVAEQVAPFAGITPAPSTVVHTSEQQRQTEAGRWYVPTPLERKRREASGR